MAKIPRVCLTGPESTGKTWIGEQLARELGTVCVPEYAREYALAHDHELTADDVSPIARGCVADVDRLAPAATGVLILDTDLLSTVVYGRHYYGATPAWIEEEARKRRADLYLLLAVDVPWVADGVRDAADSREELFARFRGVLEEFEARYVVIGGDWEHRLAQAREAVLGMLAS